MKTDKSWKSLQSMLLIAIIVLIFTYIGYDAFSFRPRISSEITSIKEDYDNLIKYKLPKIDSTLQDHIKTLQLQTDTLNKLNQNIPKK